MATSKRTRPAPEKVERPVLVTPQPHLEAEESKAPVSLLPSDAGTPSETEPEQPLPVYAEEEALEELRPDPEAEPLPKEWVVLAGPATFGPVRIGGRAVTAKKDTLYYVPDPAERIDILGSGRFRAGTGADLARSLAPSAGPGGALVRALLPEGAVKGGLSKP